jgi:hypothetical protein
MYDEYEPLPPPSCPWCGAGFGTRWQAKVAEKAKRDS